MYGGKLKRKVLTGLAITALVAGAALAVPQSARASHLVAAPADGVSVAPAGPDGLTSPIQEKAAALKQKAVTEVINGEAAVQEKNGSQVVKLAEGAGDQDDDGQYVELARQQTDHIFVVLAEFGNQRSPDYPDRDTDPKTPGPTVFDGPLHNQIPKPAADDNTTVWQPDYNQKHYQDLYFGSGESLKTYYETQSSGRYSVDGTVTDWVKVPYNEARYGRSNGYPCAETTCSNTWALLSDALDVWVGQQKAAGKTDAEIKQMVAQFDQWDRYDHDGDGNFNEPDGYIDHFQIVHAGGDQADGDPRQGEDAIWSHRWYTNYDQVGLTGPAGNELGGTQIGNTGIWVGDYTIQPENGGLSVFAHEYGHDLGLPDDYDIAGGQGEPVEWWSLMAQSRLGAKDDPLGTKPGDLGAWNKLMLGWLDYEVVPMGRRSRTIELGPEEYNTSRTQAAIVALPKKQVTEQLVKPQTGAYEWWSGSGDSLTSTLSRVLTLPAGAPQLTFQANWNIEDCDADPCDYAFVEANDGTGWKSLPGSITKAAEGNAIDGKSNGWVPATFDLTKYAGKSVVLRFRYSTDQAVAGEDRKAPAGLFLDQIAVKAGSTTVFQDGAETAAPGWVPLGFQRTTGTEVNFYDNYYIAGNRSYTGFDQYLKTGPYNAGWLTEKPDKVEHFAYQPGLLISYWDTSQSDNSVSEHPGEGLNLYVDAHPGTLYQADGDPWRARVQLYDAPFGTDKADNLSLHEEGERTRIKGLPGNPVFDDTQNYFDPVQTDHGVKVRGAGVRIEVLKQKKTAMTIRVTTP